MEIVKVDLDEIILKFKSKGSQTRHANLWLKNDGIVEVIKKENLESIYKLKKTNLVSWKGEAYRYISLKFNKFSVNEFISKCTGYKRIDVSYGCLLDQWTRFRDNDSRYKIVEYSSFENVAGVYVERCKANEYYPYNFLYNYKTSLMLFIREDKIDVNLTFLDDHLEQWKDENGFNT